jgi:ribonucleoside-triphosphate reductase
MIIEIRKRDGRVEAFNTGKIINAILKAMMKIGEVDDKVAMDVASKIAASPSNGGQPTDVEAIQDMVEEGLMDSQCKNAAREYIKYRAERNQERQRNNDINRQIEDILLCKCNNNNNANVDEKSFGGRKFESANVLHKSIALNAFIRPEVAQAHKESRIYIHDLSEYDIGSHNCLFVDLQRLLREGFTTRNGDVRPANSFSTACQLIAVIFQIQSQVQYGGVASCHIDYDLAPYVQKSLSKHFKDGLRWLGGKALAADVPNQMPADGGEYKKFCPEAWEYAIDMLQKEGLQAAQSLYHNLNTLESRAGSQIPFTSINFGTDESTEGRMVSQWLMEASIAGIGKHYLTPIFPISIFKYKKGVNAERGDKNYDLKKLAIESLSKRIYPNIVNCGFSQNEEDPGNPDTEMATMGCRTMMFKDRHGLGCSKVGRGNACPVTINLPKIGVRHGICLGGRDSADMDGFWGELEEVLKLTETSLTDRFYHLCNQSADSAKFMYRNGTVADFDKAGWKGVYESLKHCTLAVGYIGVAEMCEAMIGANHAKSEEARAFALDVVKRISDFCKEASERNDLNFSCYASPAESLCKTYAAALKKEFGEIKGVSDREYITNSHHVPVWEQVSIHRKLEIEAPFCKYPLGGCITYIELESSIMQNHKAIEDIIDYAMSLDIPYLAFNFPIDSCMKCGYQGEINYNCPKCGNTDIQRLRRVTGYLTTDYRNFNDGKIKECLDRIKHSNYTDFSASAARD